MHAKQNGSANVEPPATDFTDHWRRNLQRSLQGSVIFQSELVEQGIQQSVWVIGEIIGKLGISAEHGDSG